MAETELDPALDEEHAALRLQLREREAALAEAERRLRELTEEVEGLRSLLRERAQSTPSAPALLTAAELVQLERDNLVRALEASSWQVAGENGAARRLGVAPSTFTSRMKALGVRRQP